MTKASRLQLPLTATAVVSAWAWPPPTLLMRVAARPGPRERKASTRPLVSPRTRLEAADRNATHDPRSVKLPLTAAPHDAPFAPWPPMPRETRIVRPGFQLAPLLPTRPARLTANTSVRPLESLRTRLDAEDWKAMMRA